MSRLRPLRHYLSRKARSVPLFRKLRRLVPLRDDGIEFQSSDQYWKERYQRGGNSGEGSYGPLARYKATFINDFSRRQRVESAIELGCGDGNQAAMLNISRYIGVDISQDCVDWARANLAKPDWQFETVDDYFALARDPVELGLSLDVIYHLVEDEVYHGYLRNLARSASRYLLIYTSNLNHFDPRVPHIRHRPLIADMARLHPEWTFVRTERNPYAMRHDEDREYGSFADFHLFEKRS